LNVSNFLPSSHPVRQSLYFYSFSRCFIGTACLAMPKECPLDLPPHQPSLGIRKRAPISSPPSISWARPLSLKPLMMVTRSDIGAPFKGERLSGSGSISSRAVRIVFIWPVLSIQAHMIFSQLLFDSQKTSDIGPRGSRWKTLVMCR